MQTKISQKPEKRRHQYQNGRDTIVREVTPFLDTISQTVTVRYDISVNRNGKIIKQIQENYVMRFMFIRKWPFSCNRQVWSWSIAAHFLKQHSKKGVFTGCHSRLDLTIVTPINTNPLFKTFNQKNSSMLCIGVNKIKIHFDTSQLCCGVVHLYNLMCCLCNDRVSYAYQYQDRTGRLIFRYDNAAHRPVLGFNEHKYSSDGTIYEVVLPDIFDLVDEVISHL